MQYFFIECASFQTFKIGIVLCASLQVLFWIQHGIFSRHLSAPCRSALEKVYPCTDLHMLHWSVLLCIGPRLHWRWHGFMLACSSISTNIFMFHSSIITTLATTSTIPQLPLLILIPPLSLSSSLLPLLPPLLLLQLKFHYHVLPHHYQYHY